MPKGLRVDMKEIAATLDAALQLMSWQEQLLCSALDQLRGAKRRSPERSKPCDSKGKKRR